MKKLFIIALIIGIGLLAKAQVKHSVVVAKYNGEVVSVGEYTFDCLGKEVVFEVNIPKSKLKSDDLNLLMRYYGWWNYGDIINKAISADDLSAEDYRLSEGSELIFEKRIILIE